MHLKRINIQAKNYSFHRKISYIPIIIADMYMYLHLNLPKFIRKKISFNFLCKICLILCNQNTKFNKSKIKKYSLFLKYFSLFSLLHTHIKLKIYIRQTKNN